MGMVIGLVRRTVCLARVRNLRCCLSSSERQPEKLANGDIPGDFGAVGCQGNLTGVLREIRRYSGDEVR